MSSSQYTPIPCSFLREEEHQRIHVTSPLANSEADIFIYTDFQPFIEAHESILHSDLSGCKLYRLITCSQNYHYLFISFELRAFQFL